MKPIIFKQQNIIYADNQPQYLPLPAYKNKDGIVSSCWGLTWKERFKVLFRGRIWIEVMTFNKHLQPLKPSVDAPSFTE